MRVDYETNLAIGTGGLDHLSQSAHAFIADANYTTCWAKSVEECGNSALKAGYLVGDVSGGEFGKHHFISFYTILKKKQDYDRKKGASDKTKARRKQGMGRLYEDMAQGYAIMENNLSNISIDKLRQDPVALFESQMQAGAGMFAAAFALPLSVISVLADAVSELFGSHNDMERSLSKMHYERNMNISKLSVNEQRRLAKYTKNASEADKIIDPIITVGATVAAGVAVAVGVIGGLVIDGTSKGATGGAGLAMGTKAGLAVAGSIMTGLATYKATRGLYEGGFAGAGLQLGAAYANKALAGSGTKLLNAFNVSGNYNYNSGFSGGVGYGIGGAGQEFERRDGVNVGLNYNEQTGFGASIGYQGDHFNVGVGVSGLGGHSSGTYGNIYGGLTSGGQGDYLRGSLDLNYNYRDNSFGGGVSVLQDFFSFGNNPTYFDRFSTALNWNSEAGFSNQIQYTLSNRGFDAVTGFMQGMASNMWNMLTGLGSAVSGMWRDEDENGNKIGEIWQDESGNSWITDKNGESKYLTPDEVLEMRLRQVFGDDIRLSMVGDSKNEFIIGNKGKFPLDYYFGDAQENREKDLGEFFPDDQIIRSYRLKQGDVIETESGKGKAIAVYGNVWVHEFQGGARIIETPNNTYVDILTPDGAFLRQKQNSYSDLNKVLRSLEGTKQPWYIQLYRKIFNVPPENLPGGWKKVEPRDGGVPG